MHDSRAKQYLVDHCLNFAVGGGGVAVAQAGGAVEMEHLCLGRCGNNTENHNAVNY